jgi:hypothetical protein
MSLREWFGAATNDLGEFRIPNLQAGQSMVEADPDRPFLELHRGGKGSGSANEQAKSMNLHRLRLSIVRL